MRIGELAAVVGTTVRALRYYEEHGLLVARRASNGYRDYDEQDVLRVRNIRRLLSLGFTADDVRAFLGCLDDPLAGVCPASLPVVADKIASMDREIAALTDKRERLAAELRRFHSERVTG